MFSGRKNLSTHNVNCASFPSTLMRSHLVASPFSSTQFNSSKAIVSGDLREVNSLISYLESISVCSAYSLRYLFLNCRNLRMFQSPIMTSTPVESSTIPMKRPPLQNWPILYMRKTKPNAIITTPLAPT